jgi:hypothetical protein
MGNQLSADKEKDKDRLDKAERDRQDKERQTTKSSVAAAGAGAGAGTGTPKVERKRSRTITSTTPCPPTETKVNANAEQPIIPLDTRPGSSTIPGTPLAGQTTTPLAERRSGKSTAAKEIISAAQKLSFKELPKPTEEQIKKEAAEMEATPKFETVRVQSETSVLDEEDLKDINDEGMSLPLVSTACVCVCG